MIARRARERELYFLSSRLANHFLRNLETGNIPGIDTEAVQKGVSLQQAQSHTDNQSGCGGRR